MKAPAERLRNKKKEGAFDDTLFSFYMPVANGYRIITFLVNSPFSAERWMK